MHLAESAEPWALVAGCAGGIGSAICQMLRAKSITVVGIDRRRAKGENSVRATLGTAQGQRALQRLVQGAGAPRWAVTSVGTYARRALVSYTRAQTTSTLRDNLVSVIDFLRIIIPAMQRVGGGRIVVVGSQAGVTGGRDPVYAAAKGAAVSLVKSIAREYASDGIRCNAVNPGPVDTPMAKIMGDARRRYYERQIPIGRFVTASEVAETVVFLLTMNGEGINGATVDVDGGLVRR